MPKPIAICLEDLDAKSDATRYLQCVAVPGRAPGLCVNEHGTVVWKNDDAVACELFVSADDRLILFRPTGAALTTLRRSGRSLEVPEEKPVLVLDGDELSVSDQNLRVHVHGLAPKVVSPTPFIPKKRPFGDLARASAVALALAGAGGVAGASCDACSDIVVRDQPPSVIFEEPDAEPVPEGTGESEQQTPNEVAPTTETPEVEPEGTGSD